MKIDYLATKIQGTFSHKLPEWVYEEKDFTRAINVKEPTVITDRINTTKILFDFIERYEKSLKLAVDDFRIIILTNVCTLGRPKIHFRIYYKIRVSINNDIEQGVHFKIYNPSQFYKLTIRDIFPKILKGFEIKSRPLLIERISFRIKSDFNEILDRKYNKDGSYTLQNIPSE